MPSRDTTVQVTAPERPAAAPAWPALAPLTSLERTALVCLVGLAVALLLPNLDRFPATWFDEGWWLQIPRNLVKYGRYAPLSGSEFRATDSVVVVSPAFYLPVAASLWLFGVGLLQARLVMAVHCLVAVLLVFGLTRRLYNARAALLATALFLVLEPDDHWTSPLAYGRQVMAEMPALVWCLAGMWLWATWRRTEKLTAAVAAGVALALAAAIKPQFGVVLAPTVVAAWLVEWKVTGRWPRHAWVVVATAGVVAVLHLAFLAYMLGFHDLGRLLSGFAEASGPQVRAFLQVPALRRALGLFGRADVMAILLAALVSEGLRMRRGRPIDLGRGLPVLFVVVWLAWFTAATPGWYRYALPAFAIGVIPLAGALDRLARVYLESAAAARFAGSRRVAQIVVATFAVALLAQQGAKVAKDIAGPPPGDAQRFAAYLASQVPPGDTIATWDWPLPFLAGDNRFVLPPTRTLDSVIARIQFGVEWPAPPYDPRSSQARYLALGPFGRWSGVYPDDYLRSQGTLVFQAGEYELYRIAP